MPIEKMHNNRNMLLATKDRFAERERSDSRNQLCDRQLRRKGEAAIPRRSGRCTEFTRRRDYKKGFERHKSRRKGRLFWRCCSQFRERESIWSIHGHSQGIFHAHPECYFLALRLQIRVWREHESAL